MTIVRRSVQNKIYLIVATLLTFALIITLLAIYLANTLSMVTDISRAERSFTYNILSGQVAAFKYLRTPTQETKDEFNASIDAAYDNAGMFGRLPDLVEKHSADEVAAMLDRQFAEFDRKTSEIIVNRIRWLGWLPEVEELVAIAYEGHIALKIYREATARIFDLPPGFEKKRLVAKWYRESAEVLEYPARFSFSAGELSTFVVKLATGALIGLLLLLTVTGAAVSSAIARSIVRPIKAETDRLLESAAAITDTAKQSSAIVQEQSTALTQISTTVEQISQMSEVSAAGARDVLSSSTESASQGREGLAAVTEAVEIMNAVSEVSAVLDSVDDLAGQSNLLAVNAGIEAAKAGEAGRGFSVVAAEVRTLASQSKNATTEIRSAISRTENGRRAAESIHATVSRLAASLQDNADRARHISDAAIQQSAGIKQISDAMQQMSLGSQDTADAVQALEQAVENLSSVAWHLNKVITG